MHGNTESLAQARPAEYERQLRLALSREIKAARARELLRDRTETALTRLAEACAS